jgi:hypothetical protein
VAVAFLNCINMLGGSFFHTIIGCTMDYFWTGGLSPEKTKVYDLITYKYAISVVPISAVVGSVIVYILSITRKRRG